MSLNDNPIFLTQKRLVHRSGVLAAIMIAALVGLCLLAGLIAAMAGPHTIGESPPEMGKTFYGWAIGLEIIVLLIGGFIRITRAISDERKAGLWDSNRLTPLKPWQIVVGYWFGAPLREFYMSVVLAVIGLVIVLLAKLPITLWLGTQLLIASTALFLGLFAVLLGVVLQKPQNGAAIVVLLFGIQLFSFTMPKAFLPVFLLPIYGIVNLFADVPTGNFYNGDNHWAGLPQIFGLPVYPILLSLCLQLLIGIFLWRMVIRRTADPFQPALLRWEATALFAILLLCQHGLIWGAWLGDFPDTSHTVSDFDDASPLLPIVHGGTMAIALVILGFLSPLPESIRLKVLRSGNRNTGAIFTQSAVGLAFGLSAIAAVVLFSQFTGSIRRSWEIYLIAVGNLLSFSLIFAFLLEFCRLRYKRRALGFVVLWLFVLCVLPFIMAGVLGDVSYTKVSILTPGGAALADPGDENLNCLLGIVAGHFLIAILLFIAWQREWRKLLTRAV